jgi:hypothetical protein
MRLETRFRDASQLTKVIEVAKRGNFVHLHIGIAGAEIDHAAR